VLDIAVRHGALRFKAAVLGLFGLKDEGFGPDSGFPAIVTIPN